MKRVMFIADDFGASREVNEAIVHTHRRGALHGAALMMGQDATAHAVALARENPALQVGLHLHLADSRPCTADAWPWGRSPARAGFAMALFPGQRALMRREVHAQWRAFRATGLTCRFVNAHHHLHVHPLVRRAMRDALPAELGGWLRWGRPRYFSRGPATWPHTLIYLLLQAPVRRRLPWDVSTTLWGLDRTFRMDAGEVQRVLPTLGDGVHEFMFHPRRPGSDPDSQCLLGLSR